MLKKALISTGVFTLIVINLFLWPTILNYQNQSHKEVVKETSYEKNSPNVLSESSELNSDTANKEDIIIEDNVEYIEDEQVFKVLKIK